MNTVMAEVYEKKLMRYSIWSRHCGMLWRDIWFLGAMEKKSLLNLLQFDFSDKTVSKQRRQKEIQSNMTAVKGAASPCREYLSG
jgi:hypothetical protein